MLDTFMEALSTLVALGAVITIDRGAGTLTLLARRDQGITVKQLSLKISTLSILHQWIVILTALAIRHV